MILDPASRRAFLRVAGSTGATWLLADAVLIREAFAHAVRQRGRPEARFESLASGMAEDLEAVVARIIPSNGSPGAREAGVIHFIDRSLTTFAADQKPLMEEGVADLNRRAATRWPGTPSFAALPAERQDELLHDIEKSDFFQAVRIATLTGMFADPSWGGNRDHLGWTLIGQGHEPFYQPPFGWYDADANGRR